MLKVALITGGARGIGKKIAETLAEDGFVVIVNYNASRDRAMSMEREMIAKGYQAMFVQADISNEVEVQAMVDKIINKYGRIDVLVNNSAVTHDSLFQDKDAKSFADVLNVNLIGTFNVSKIVGEIMYNNKYGKIINMSSTNGMNTYYPMCIEYDASKAGINSLTHNLAMQFKPYVMVNAVAPGFIATESEVCGMDDEYIDMEVEKIMLRRAGKEEDVANLVSFLASSKSDYINNQIIKINGGMYGD